MIKDYFENLYKTKQFNVFNEGETGIEYSYYYAMGPQDYYECLSCEGENITSDFSYCPHCGCKIVEDEKPFE